jgi:hypothetical protein
MLLIMKLPLFEQSGYMPPYEEATLFDKELLLWLNIYINILKGSIEMDKKVNPMTEPIITWIQEICGNSIQIQ